MADNLAPQISNPPDQAGLVGTNLCSPFTASAFNFGPNLLPNGDFEQTVGTGAGTVAGPGWTTDYPAADPIYVVGGNVYAAFTTNAGQITSNDVEAVLFPAIGTKSVAFNAGGDVNLALLRWSNIPMVNGETYIVGVNTAMLHGPFTLAVRIDGNVVMPVTPPVNTHPSVIHGPSVPVGDDWEATRSEFVWTGTTGNHEITITSGSVAAQGNDMAFDEVYLRRGTAIAPVLTSTPAGPGNAVVTNLGSGNYEICYTPTDTAPRTFTVTYTDDQARSASQDVVFTGTVPANTCLPATTVGATVATVHGNLAGPPPAGSVIRFRYSTTNGGPYTTITASQPAVNGDNARSVTGLAIGVTHYYVMDLMTGATVWSTSGQCSFTTVPPPPPTITAPAPAAGLACQPVCVDFKANAYNFDDNSLVNGNFEESTGVGTGSVPGPGWTTQYEATNNLFAPPPSGIGTGENSWRYFTTDSGQLGDGGSPLMPALGARSIGFNVGADNTRALFQWTNIPLVNGEIYTMSITVGMLGPPYGVGIYIDGVLQLPLTTPPLRQWTETRDIFVWSGTTGPHTVSIATTDNTAGGNDHVFDNVELRRGTLIPVTANNGATVTHLGGDDYRLCATPGTPGPHTYTISTTNSAGVTVTQNAVITGVVPALTKTTSGPTNRLAGESVTSTATVTNPSSSPLTGLTFTDNVPAFPAGTTRTWTATTTAGVTGVPASGTGNTTLTGITLPANGSATFTMVDTVVNTGSYQNAANCSCVTTSVTGQQVIFGQNIPPVVTLTTPPPSETLPSVQQCATFSVTDGTALPVTVAVTPASQPAPVPVVPTLTNLGGGNYQICVNAGSTGTFPFTLVATDSLGLTDSKTATFVYARHPNLSGTGTVKSTNPPSQAQIPHTIDSDIRVVNDGTAPALGVRIFDPIPATPSGITRTWTSTGDLVSSGTGNIDVTLDIINSVSFVIHDTVPNVGTYKNVATITGGELPSPLVLGDQTIYLYDAHCAPATSVTATSATLNGTLAGATAPGAGRTTFSYGTTPGGPYPTTTPEKATVVGNNFANVTGLIADTDYYYVMNTSYVGSNVTTTTECSFNTRQPNIGGTKTVLTPPPYNVNSPITSILTVTNTGTAAGVGTALDPIPASPAGTTRTYTSAATGGATGNTPSGTTGIFDTLNMPAGSSVVYTINDTPRNIGTYQNLASINGNPLPPTPPTPVDPPPTPNVTRSKTTAGPTTRVAGDTIVSTVIVSNTGTATATGVTVLDQVPVAPTGTTRTFTSVSAGGASGASPTGTGTISDTLTIPAGGSVTYTINDTVTTRGIYQNTVTVNGSSVSGQAVRIGAPNLVSTKTTAGSGTRNVGDTITSTLTVSNTGDAATTTTVVDPIPAVPAGTIRAFTSVSVGGATGNTVSGTTGINDTVTLPANSSVTYTVNDTVTAVGAYQNLATVGGVPIPPEPPRPIDPSLTPNIVTAKVTAGAAVRQVGDVITSTVTISNTGTGAGTGVTVSDPVPAGFSRTYTSVSAGGASGASGAGTGAISNTLNMPAGSSVTYNVSDTVLAGATTYTNTVTVLGTPTSGQTVTIVAPNITKSKTTAGAATRNVGDTIVSTITISNTGTATGTQTVSDPIPASPVGTTRTWTLVLSGGATNLIGTSGTAAITDTVTLPPASSAVYTVNDTIRADGPYQNRATIGGTPIPPEPPIAIPKPNVVATKVTQGPKDRLVGDTVTSVLTVSNTGLGASSNYPVLDPIPASPAGTTRTFTSVATGGATGNTATGTTGINDSLFLPAGSSVVYTINDTLNAVGSYQNKATTGGVPIPPEPPTNAGVPIVGQSKATAGPNTRNVGDVVVSTVIVSNTGTAVATAVTVSDPVPAAPAGTTRTFTSTATPGATGNTASGVGAITNTLTIPANGSVTYTIFDTVNATGTYQNTATVNGTPVTGKLVTVVAPNVTRAKVTDGPTTRNVGDIITSTVTVGNDGTATAANVTVSDAIPSTPPSTTRTFTSTVTGGATGNTASGTSNINDSVTLPPGSQIVYTILDTVTKTGVYTNVAIVGGTTVSGVPITIIGPALGLAKVTQGASIRKIGDVITSKVTVSNTGTADQTNVSITDNVPVGPTGTTRTWTTTITGAVLGVPAGGTGNIVLTGVTLPAGSSVVFTVQDTVMDYGSYTNVATITSSLGTLRREGQTVTIPPPGSTMGMCGAINTTCSPWITPADLSACCGTVVPCDPTGSFRPVDLDIALSSIQIASEWLYNLTAHLYPGKCRQTIRPCNVKKECACYMGDCGCGPVEEIDLGCWPVCEINEVKINGINQNLAGWHINDSRYLARNKYVPDTCAVCDGKCECMPGLPCCQDMNADDSCPGTWSVTFTCGADLPYGAKNAAAKLACELAKSCKNDATCALPKRVTNITRQGVSMALLDNLDFVKDGLTGIYEVDMWVKSVNPHGNRMPYVVVWSPDLPRSGRKMFSDRR